MNISRPNMKYQLIAKDILNDDKVRMHQGRRRITVNKTVEKGGIWVLIKSPVLRKRFLIIVFAWFAVSLTFICLGFNVGKFGLNIFLTELLFGLTELPAHLLCFWLLELAGRKLCLMSAILVGGLACLSILAVPAGNAIAVTVLAITARILMTVGSSISSVYIQELFPTSARHTAAGLGGLATRVAGLLAPSVNLLVVYHYSIPISVFSSLTLLGGALIFLLPETRGIELADSTAQAEIQSNGTKVEKGRRSITDDHTAVITSSKL